MWLLRIVADGGLQVDMFGFTFVVRFVGSAAEGALRVPLQ